MPKIAFIFLFILSSLNIRGDELSLSDAAFMNNLGILIPPGSNLILTPDKGRGEIWQLKDHTTLQINRLPNKTPNNPLDNDKKELYLLKKQRELSLSITQILSLSVKKIKKDHFKNHDLITIEGTGYFSDNKAFFYREFLYSFHQQSLQLIYTNTEKIPDAIPVNTQKMEQALL